MCFLPSNCEGGERNFRDPTEAFNTPGMEREQKDARTLTFSQNSCINWGEGKKGEEDLLSGKHLSAQTPTGLVHFS